MKKWTLRVTVEVADIWVADGYEATAERIQRILEENDMTWATPEEYRVTVEALSSPKRETIKALQGEA